MFVYLLWNLYQLKKNAAGNEEQIKALQEKKLRKLLRYAYHNSAYYHRTFTRAGISEENIDRISLKQFPVINKDLLM